MVFQRNRINRMREGERKKLRNFGGLCGGGRGNWQVWVLQGRSAGGRPREELMLQLTLEASGGRIPSSSENLRLFSGRPSAFRRRPIHIVEEPLLYSKPTDLKFISSKKHLHSVLDWHLDWLVTNYLGSMASPQN